jgi:outer membrane receptor protein involved in Fe transport
MISKPAEHAAAVPRCRLPAAMALAALLPLCAAAAVQPPPGVQELAGMPLDALLDLEVTGASRRAQRSSEAAGAVTVITAEEIRALGYRTIADALRSVRGLSVVYDRSYTFLGVRGFYAPGDYNTRVLLLVDGNRVNDNLYDQAYVGSEAPLDIEEVERIEFIPGQGAAVYGANALFGVVNVVTRTPGAASSGAAVAFGSGHSREARASWRGGSGGTAWLLSASRRVARGADLHEPEAVSQGIADGVLRGTDHEQVNRLRLAAQGEAWRLNLLHADRGKGIGAPVSTVFGDPRSTNRDVQTLVDASWQQPLAGHGEWQARIYAGRYRFIGDYVVDYPPVTLNRDDDDGRWWGAEGRVASGAVAGHMLQLGFELQRSTRLSFRNFDLDGEGTAYLDTTTRDHRFAVYGEDRIELAPGWHATLGVRADKAAGRGLEWHPRLALIGRVGEPWVFKLVHGSAFRPPNAFERLYEVDGPGGYVRNPSLRVETVRGTEAIVEWTPRRDLRATLSAYSTRARDLIVLGAVPDSDMYMFENQGTLELRGAEAELQWRSEGGFALRGNVSLQRPRGAEGAAFVDQSPSRLAKLTAIVPLAARWTLGCDAQALSRRGAAGGFGVVNANLVAPTPWRGAQVSLRVTNLLDRRYADPGALPERQPLVVQDGRGWRLAVTLPL